MAVLVSAAAANGADLDIRPGILVSEEFNDNVFLEVNDENEDYITRIVPSLTLSYKLPLFSLDTLYSYDYRYYNRKNLNDLTTQTLNLNSTAEVIQKNLFLKVSDEYGRVTLDGTRDTTAENFYINQTDRNVFTFNPYLMLRPQARLSVAAGYEHVETWYKEEQGIDKKDDSGYIDSSFELSDKTLLKAGYRYAHENSNALDFVKNEAYIETRYLYAERSSVFLRLGNSMLDFKDREGYSRVIWGAGILHSFPRSAASLSYQTSIMENPSSTPQWKSSYSAQFSSKLDRDSFTVDLNHNEFRDLEDRKLDTRSYGASTAFKHEFSDSVSGSVSYGAEKFEYEAADAHTLRQFVNAAASYAIAKDGSINAVYSYSTYSSPKIVNDNYDNNRFTVELKYTF